MPEITDEEKAVIEAAKAWKAWMYASGHDGTLTKIHSPLLMDLDKALDALPKAYVPLLTGEEIEAAFHGDPCSAWDEGLRAVEVLTIRKLAEVACRDGNWTHSLLAKLATKEEKL